MTDSVMGGNSSLALEGMCRWEFETGPMQIPIFQEKVTHSYTNRPTFDQNYRIFFSKFELILAQILVNLEKLTVILDRVLKLLSDYGLPKLLVLHCCLYLWCLQSGVLLQDIYICKGRSTWFSSSMLWDPVD